MRAACDFGRPEIIACNPLAVLSLIGALQIWRLQGRASSLLTIVVSILTTSSEKRSCDHAEAEVPHRRPTFKQRAKLIRLFLANDMTLSICAKLIWLSSNRMSFGGSNGPKSSSSVCPLFS
jgi:hypothetical protein